MTGGHGGSPPCAFFGVSAQPKHRFLCRVTKMNNNSVHSEPNREKINQKFFDKFFEGEREGKLFSQKSFLSHLLTPP